VAASRYAVVGAGILGLATARELWRRHPHSAVTVVDKEPAVAGHQTGHNSGVIHAGVYYPAGSLKARLCAEGRRSMMEFCSSRGVPYEVCGKIVVARESAELAQLDEIELRARANGVPGLRRLDAREIRRIEPAVAGVAALHSPQTAIVDFSQVARAMAADLDVRLRFPVTSIRPVGREIVLGGPAGDLAADRVVLCAGLQSDELARLAGDESGPAIMAFRGEYWRLLPDKSSLVRGLVYPVPDPRYPFLGVHFTRRMDGGVDLGPNAVLALAREGYRWADVDVREVVDMLRWPGFWRMASRHWRAGLMELYGSLSKGAFIAEARRLVPDIGVDDVTRAPSGVRAQAVDPDGSLLDDFRISQIGEGGRILSVRNAPSPGATSSMAIARYLADRWEGV
jgi:L-2-hydroxyglutarate oxidase LhgO